MKSVQETAMHTGQNIQLTDAAIKWTKEHGFISFITDCEGDFEKYTLQKVRNESMIAGVKETHHELNTVKTTVIYGGDVTDKGKGNIQILLDLRASRASGNALSILGNRDANKIRLLEALSPMLCECFSEIEKKYAYWAAGTNPKAWLEAQRSKHNAHISRKPWQQFTQAEKHIAILRFIFEETMGAPNYLNDLSKELRILNVLSHDSSNEDLIVAIYELHFPKALCDEFRRKGWIPNTTILSDDYQGLQSDYVEHATLGTVIGGVIFEHSLNQVFPRKQDGSEIGLFTKHRAKIELMGSMALMLLSIASLPQLLAFSFVGAMATVTIGAVVALYLAYDAYKTSQKSIVSRWFEVRNTELAQYKKSYLKIAMNNPDDLFDWSADADSLLKPHPYLSAGLPQNDSIARTISSEKTCLKDVIVLTNSTNKPMTDEHAALLENNGAKAAVYGHQPAPLQLLHKLKSGFWTAGCDVTGNAIGGGVVVGANLYATEHLEKHARQPTRLHVVASNSDEPFGHRRVGDGRVGDVGTFIATTEKSLAMLVDTSNNFFNSKGIVDDSKSAKYQPIRNPHD